jgi:hypothetical protein
MYSIYSGLIADIVAASNDPGCSADIPGYVDCGAIQAQAIIYHGKFAGYTACANDNMALACLDVGVDAGGGGGSESETYQSLADLYYGIYSGLIADIVAASNNPGCSPDIPGYVDCGAIQDQAITYHDKYSYYSALAAG